MLHLAKEKPRIKHGLGRQSLRQYRSPSDAEWFSPRIFSCAVTAGFDHPPRLRIRDRMPRNQALRSKWLAAVPPPPHTWSGLLCPVSGVFLSSKPDLSQSKPVFVAYRRSLDGRVLAYSCTRAGARNGWLRFSGSEQRPWFSPRLYHIRSTATASAALLGPEAGLCVHLPKHNCPIAMSRWGDC